MQSGVVVSDGLTVLKLVTVKVNGQTVSTTSQAFSDGSSTENYIASCINGSWRIVAVTQATLILALTYLRTLRNGFRTQVMNLSQVMLVTVGDSAVTVPRRSTAGIRYKLIGVVTTAPHTVMGYRGE